MATELGLRERKKQRTRQLIADTAWGLFAKRGFDRVTVAEIARDAEVAEATVFNYFPTKEDLIYHRMEAFEGEMLSAVRDRGPNESLVDAFGRFVLTPRGALGSGDPGAAEQLTTISRVITNSPALVARERQIFERYTNALAALIARETGKTADDLEPWVIANALIGVHIAVLGLVRRRSLEGAEPSRTAREVRRQGRRALDALAEGLDRTR